MDCSLPGSSVHGIFQAIILEWIAISFSKESSRPRDRTRVSHIVDRRFTICDLSQKANPGLLHCRQTLYDLSHEGSPSSREGNGLEDITDSMNVSLSKFWEIVLLGLLAEIADGKASVYGVGDLGLIPGLGRFLGEGNGNPLQYYCLENPMDRGPW